MPLGKPGGIFMLQRAYRQKEVIRVESPQRELVSVLLERVFSVGGSVSSKGRYSTSISNSGFSRSSMASLTIGTDKIGCNF